MLLNSILKKPVKAMTKQDLLKYLRHIKKRKAVFWGKSERVYLFYDSQQVLLEDLIRRINRKGE